MSVISTIVKSALALDQKVQAGVHTVAHKLASLNFKQAQITEEDAISDAENKALQLERLRASKAAALVQQHKQALKRMHESVDNELELVDGRKAQALGKATQYRAVAAYWQSTAIRSDLAAEAARKATAQLG